MHLQSPARAEMGVMLFCEASETAALCWQCRATWEKPYLLSRFKQVIIIHEQICSWQFVIAKLPFTYTFGLHPKDTTLPVQKWNLGDCFKCWRLPPLTYFLLYQRRSWLDRKAFWLAPSHPVCFCTSLLCAAGSCSYSFFMTLPHYTLSNCSLFLWPWSPPDWSKRSGTMFLSYLLERLETWGYFSAKKFVFTCTLVGFFTVLSCNVWVSAVDRFCSPLATSWILVLNDSCLQTSYICIL